MIFRGFTEDLDYSTVAQFHSTKGKGREMWNFDSVIENKYRIFSYFNR